MGPLRICLLVSALLLVSVVCSPYDSLRFSRGDHDDHTDWAMQIRRRERLRHSSWPSSVQAVDPEPGRPPSIVDTSPDIRGLWESEIETIRNHSTPAYNVALGGKASQSSTQRTASATNAVDGDLSPPCSSTKVEYSPWWTVDLLSNHAIYSVAVTNRKDCCAQDLNGAEIYIGNIRDWRENHRCGVVSSMGLGETYSFSCHGMEGQFVTIAIKRNTSLSLCEVQVFGRPKNIQYNLPYEHLKWQQHGAPNVASKGIASQSSDLGAAKASVANDGDLTNYHPKCSHTDFNIEPWWRLDLKSSMKVFSVAITNRLECCGFRLNGAEIRVGLSQDVKSNPRCSVLTTVDRGATISVHCHGMLGRYVSVNIPSRTEYLTLCEVQVFALPAEIPKYGNKMSIQPATIEEPIKKLEPEKKPNNLNAVLVPEMILKEASQSSVNGESVPTKTINGSLLIKESHRSCSVTKEEYEPWWSVSLDSNYLVSAIALTSPKDCCDWGLDGAEIHIGYDPDWRKNPICGVVLSMGLGKTFLFKCHEMGGRFVTIVIPNKTTSLTVCHVQLFGKKVDKPISHCTQGEDDEMRKKNHGALNVAPQGLASQPRAVSYIYWREAKLAIDENLNSNFYNKSCTHTKEEWAPWWTVDLRSRMRVSSIVITNRGDCCRERLSGAEIRIGNSKERDNPRCAVLPYTLDRFDTFFLDCEGMVGRYVSIVITGRKEWLHLCEVQVFAEPVEDQTESEEENPADGEKKTLSKARLDTVFAEEIELSKVHQSSTNYSAVVKKTIGRATSREGAQSQCAVTEVEYEPWWTAQLNKLYKIYSVALTNRGDCCASGLDGAEIRVGENALEWRRNRVCGTVSSIGLGETYSFKCNWLKGKFITIVIPHQVTSLVLCQVQVFGLELETAHFAGDAPSEYAEYAPQPLHHGAPNVAPRGLPSQAQHYDHTRYAKLAIDGDKSTNYYERSCAHLQDILGPWWRVDLLSKMRVFSVAITNRRGQQLSGAEIRIGDLEVEGGGTNPRCATFNTQGHGKTFIFDCGGMEGRFVTVLLPKQNKHLSICEVQVFAEPAEERKEEMFYNVALNGTASQSSTFSLSGEAGNANDGSLANNHIMAQCSITKRQLFPWWMVDLHATYKIFSVVITNRVLECCKDRIYGAQIRIGNSSIAGGMLNPRCGVITSMESGESLSFLCNGMLGRYVSVTVPGREEHLILCEVQVYGLPEMSNGDFTSVNQQSMEIPNGAPNVAINGISSQSSLYNNFGESKNAIDGSLFGIYALMQCSMTAWMMRPWWIVDLKKVHVVLSVAVTNRRDCCWQRINEAEIRIGNSTKWAENPRCAVIYSLGPGETGMFNCKGMKGRYVMVIIPDREDKLSLCEVQVFGLPVSSSEIFPPNGIEGIGLAGKALLFPQQGGDSYAVLNPSLPIDLTQFTLCLRVATELLGYREVILFSYHNMGDELNLWKETNGKLSLYLSSSSHAAMFSLPGFSTFGTHLCVTWDSLSGLTSFWVDGKQSMSKIYRKGHQVLPGGTVILGQDQDSLQSSFDPKQSFVGEISDVHLWNYILPPEVFKELSQRKSSYLGNIINWDSVSYRLYGNVVVK